VTNNDRDDPIPIEARPPLHPPKVHTMSVGHIPLTFLVTGSASFIYAVAFNLGTAPPTASMVILVVLLAASALVLSAGKRIPIADEGLTFSRTLTTGTRFTLVRVTIVCLLGGLAVLPTTSDQPTALLWSLAVLGLGAALLETSDNWLARITGSRSLYSDRLSNMTGAVFALVLAFLPVQLGLIDTWVIAAGVIGFADMMLSPRGSKGETPLWQIWSRLIARVLMLAILMPLGLDWVRLVFSGLAVLIISFHVVLALKVQKNSTNTQN
jgi:hypothetical protein